MKLFTIGDSLSQGYMSAAAARTDLCYSTLIAQKMGLPSYDYPRWEAGGLPLNIEAILRHLQSKFGTDINWFEFPQAVLEVLDQLNISEEYYERGPGSINQPYNLQTEFFHNVAISGFDVADAWSVTAENCKAEIKVAPNGGNDRMQGPNADFYRIANVVLNPSQKPEFDNFTQLDWYKYHAEREGVENLLLWLGSNHALGTVLGFKLNKTPNSGQDLTQLSHQEREQWNLWHPNDFQREYQGLLDRVDAVIQVNRAETSNVFIGTIPLVTIIPFAKGFGKEVQITHRADYSDEMLTSVYYEYYSYFFRDGQSKPRKGYLDKAQVLEIDETIREYNRVIRRLIAMKNQQYSQPRYHLVDTSKVLQDLAFKRNAGKPKYVLPDQFKQYPTFNTRFYSANQLGQLEKGGFFSLDGIHPTAIGQGIIAHEFLKVMKDAGAVPDAELNWDRIFSSDSLYTNPIALMHELYEHDLVANLLVKA
ncbi:MAG: hypothetical protein HC860_09835 [Alkalinema sp. RU_4_3]|nr:hypothetical protein [Alkalinema sp. RU_4_3]